LSRYSAWRKSGANDRFLVNTPIRWPALLLLEPDAHK
jgi:hypothetical protein